MHSEGTQDAGMVARRSLLGGQGRPGGCGTAGAPRPERCALPGNGRLQHARRRRTTTLPAGQGSQTRQPTTSSDTSPSPLFAHIHVDLVGPLLPSRSHTYLFTIINRTSRWAEAISLSSITAADCARALFAGWVSRFGVPATITSDRGPSSRPPCGRASAVYSTSSICP